MHAIITMIFNIVFYISISQQQYTQIKTLREAYNDHSMCVDAGGERELHPPSSGFIHINFISQGLIQGMDGVASHPP